MSFIEENGKNFISILSRYDNKKSSEKIHAYGVGAMKTGTHSITNVFSKFRSAHEPDVDCRMPISMAIERGEVSDKEINNFLYNRHMCLGYEFEASAMIVFYIENLIKIFPDSKFILTIRDCFSWLDSAINYILNLRSLGIQERSGINNFYSTRFGNPPLKYNKEEKILELYGLNDIDGYFSYWKMHNEKIINSVPEEKLLIIETKNIRKQLQDIADFIGVDISKLNEQGSHSFETPVKFNVIEKIDKEYLMDKAEFYCKHLMSKYIGLDPASIRRRKVINGSLA